jgi:hypothetical protein
MTNLAKPLFYVGQERRKTQRHRKEQFREPKGGRTPTASRQASRHETKKDNS